MYQFVLQYYPFERYLFIIKTYLYFSFYLNLDISQQTQTSYEKSIH